MTLHERVLAERKQAAKVQKRWSTHYIYVADCHLSAVVLLSLLLLCSRVPSPAVLCVHRPLISLLSSHAPSSSARPLVLWVCTSSTDPTHYSTPSRSLSGARHILIPPVSSTFLCVVSLDRSVAFLVQSLHRTEFIASVA